MDTFSDRLATAIRQKRSILCVGLDTNITKVPNSLVRACTRLWPQDPLSAVRAALIEFNQRVIDAVSPYAVAVKPQLAFYEQYGSRGIEAYERTIEYARQHDLLVIGDGKRGDGGETANAYANGHLGLVTLPNYTSGFFDIAQGPMRVDCLTVNGYIGDDCVRRFGEVARVHGTGIFVVGKTSFEPNSRLEQLRLADAGTVWQAMAGFIDGWGKGTEGACGYRNIGAVVGATHPEEARWMRNKLPRSWFLVPGFGAQGGGADDAVVAVNKDGLGCVVNSSRAITYPPTATGDTSESLIAEAAIRARDALNAALSRAGKLAF